MQPMDILFNNPTKMGYRNTVMGILDIGRTIYITVIKCLEKSNGLKGALSYWYVKIGEVYDALDKFFGNSESEELPFTMRIVLDETGMTTRDDNPCSFVLPPYMTKLRLYVRFSGIGATLL